jgi:hypothetical protein
MSKLVIGSPLIMHATCARVGDTDTAIKARAALLPKTIAESRRESATILVILAVLIQVR